MKGTAAIIAGVGTAAVIAVAACSSTPAAPSTADTGVNRPTASSTSPTSSTTSTTAANLRLGDSTKWEDGLSVTLSKAEPFTPSDSAAILDPSAKAFVKINVTLVNGTAANFDPAVFHMSAQAGNKEAQQVFDSAKGINSSPSTMLLPTRETQFPVVFGVLDAANPDLVVQVTPDFQHKAQVFTS